jgi:hypothetical protein
MGSGGIDMREEGEDERMLKEEDRSMRELGACWVTQCEGITARARECRSEDVICDLEDEEIAMAIIWKRQKIEQILRDIDVTHTYCAQSSET